MTWDSSFDFIVVGSGAGGMTASVVASELGGDSLVIEKTDQFGGTTALSGGVIWVPNNDSMAEAGIKDSAEDGLAYLRAVVGPDVPEEKLKAYVEQAPAMVRFMGKRTPVKYFAADRYADYYPELPGGKTGGRSMDPDTISRFSIGKEAPNQRYPGYLTGFLRFSITVRESREVMDMSLKGKYYMARNILRYYLDIPSRLKGLPDRRYTLGRALVTSCRKAMLDRDIPLWLNTEATQLIVENQRVVGIEVNREGRTLRLEARKGVLLAAGGMGQNIPMRQQYGQLPTGEAFSSACPGNMGDGIRMGQDIGADVAFMGSAWWTPSVRLPDGTMLALISGKAMPGSMFVDSSGHRFCNEAAPYEDVVKEFWKNHNDGTPSVPSYMVFDARYRHLYSAGPLVPGKIQSDDKLPEHLSGNRFLKKADTLEELAKLIGVDAKGLQDAVERQNGFACSGKDLDFGRGDSAHDQYYSDPKVGPNPCLAPIDQAPFYAMAVYPGDLGTKGGLKCDEYARVLTHQNEIIDGFYVTGNCAGSVMGDSYPGAGSTIGPSMTFGYVAAAHAMQGKMIEE
ncbi:MAG: FAD-binding protein [Pseudomonadales bacterium]